MYIIIIIIIIIIYLLLKHQIINQLLHQPMQ